MFQHHVEELHPKKVTRYQLQLGQERLTFANAVEYLQSSSEFRKFITDLLKESEFEAFRWETPGLTKSNADQPFQFVLLNSPGFCSRKTDASTFRPHFNSGKDGEGIVTFANLGGDAKLIVPSPRTQKDVYGHLASFVRFAPSSQVDELWKVVGNEVTSSITDQPIWLNTAGGGVAWLHVRIDNHPKYYRFTEFKSFIG